MFFPLTETDSRKATKNDNAPHQTVFNHSYSLYNKHMSGEGWKI